MNDKEILDQMAHIWFDHDMLNDKELCLRFHYLFSQLLQKHNIRMEYVRDRSNLSDAEWEQVSLEYWSNEK